MYDVIEEEAKECSSHIIFFIDDKMMIIIELI